MKRFILFLIILCFLTFISKPIWSGHIGKLSFLDPITSKIASIKDDPDVVAALDVLTNTFQTMITQLDDTFENLRDDQNQSTSPKAEKPMLSPSDQVFSIHNIELGDSMNDVEGILGAPQRISVNEYGVNWYSYHQNYQNFLMVSYDEKDKVNGLYTNQDLISSSNGVKLGSSMDDVRAFLGEPLTGIRKGFVSYQIQSDEYHIFKVDNSYITVFYDQHKDETVTAIQVIKEDLENSKKGIYPESSEKLIDGFAYQLFDLTNAARVNHNLGILQWDESIRKTAQSHSVDMAEKNYFNHVNLEGQSPFDRMENDKIRYSTAGENIAYGQLSSIFAHEGLMNSMGHRENILQPNFAYLGVGIAFNEQSQPYFTENFYR